MRDPTKESPAGTGVPGPFGARSLSQIPSSAQGRENRGGQEIQVGFWAKGWRWVLLERLFRSWFPSHPEGMGGFGEDCLW